MISQITVTKRNGQQEQLQLDKLHKMVDAACEGLTGVSASQIEINSNIKFHDKITTKDIQETLIKSAADLISESTPNYQYVAAKLRVYSLRKEVWGGVVPPTLKTLVEANIKQGVYDKDLLKYFSDEEFEQLNKMIVHDRDLDFTYAGIEQVYSKYLVQNRSTKQRFETPQFAYILIAAILFKDYPVETKLSYIKKYYDAISLHKISLPTPIIAGVRTNTKQFSSCTLMSVGDSLDSLCATNSAIATYIANKAGIGFDFTRVRGIGAKIRGGEVRHTGVVPLLKWYAGAVNSLAQGGIRKGSATCFFPIWHWEIEDVLVLKNNKGSDDNRVRTLDYGIGFSKIFYERYNKNEKITLFSPEEVPELVEAWGFPEFDELYLKAEKKTSIRKKSVSARELMDSFAQERFETGRIYLVNVDHANSHSHTFDQITMSNLCVAGDTKIEIVADHLDIVEIDIQNLQFYLDNYKNVKVYSRNLKTNEDGFYSISNFAMTSPSTEVLEIIDELGNSLICTPEHKIYTHNRGYVMAKDLVEYDVLVNPDQ